MEVCHRHSIKRSSGSCILLCYYHVIIVLAKSRLNLIKKIQSLHSLGLEKKCLQV